MATGHILPGYGEPVTRLRRVRSAGCYPLDNSTLLELENASRLTQHEFDHIREKARQLWSGTSPRATTYDTFYKDGTIQEVTQARPTSSHRHNNPHPPPVFLTNRLHYIEGYHNPDTTIGKGSYKIDASVSPSVQAQRRAPRFKYVARPDSALVNQFKDPYGFKKHLPPREAQAAEAWVKLADDADRDKVMEVIRESEEIKQLHDGSNLRPHTAYPSLHRWMKLSGAKEYDVTSRIMKTLNSDPLKTYESCSYIPQHLGHKREKDIASTGQYRFHPRLGRGEYSMHPGWPSSIPHHRVP